MIRLIASIFAAIFVLQAAAIAQVQPQPAQNYVLTLSKSQTEILWTIIQKVPLPREATEELATEVLRQVTEQEQRRAKAAQKAQQKKTEQPKSED